MTLKEFLKLYFGTDLPISGGNGSSIENRVIIHKSGINDYVGTEHFILNCLGKGRNLKWKILEQALLNHNDKKIDRIKIETIKTTELEIITQIENYYFDITECYGNEIPEDGSFNEKETLDKIKNRLIELQGYNEFNKKCIDLIKTGNFFDDIDLTMEFLDVICTDESSPLFESMMKNAKKSIMDVLKIVGKELS